MQAKRVHNKFNYSINSDTFFFLVMTENKLLNMISINGDQMICEPNELLVMGFRDKPGSSVNSKLTEFARIEWELW